MKTVGCVMGKYLPPHRGHLASILTAHSMCDELYVIVCKNDELDTRLCEGHCKPIPAELRKQWLMQELQGFDTIHVALVDEVGLECFPDGDWSSWATEITKIAGGKIDFIYGGEASYKDWCKQWFPESEYVLIDPKRTKYPISGTEIRDKPLQHWDYIIGAARPFFAKKVLIAGTESCGKTTMTKKLAKMYHTSWSEEIGRYYSERYLGGDETAFRDPDFHRIAYLQYENDLDVVRHANRVCLFDTDATITAYYAEIYLGHSVPAVEQYVDANRYDLVLFMTPEVKWVADGLRFLGEQKKREDLHRRLLQMYRDRGFKNIVEISGATYAERLTKCIDEIDTLMK